MSKPAGRLLSPVRAFIATEASGGVLLLLATVIALLWANSPWADSYVTFWRTGLPVGLGPVKLDFDLRLWVNDGLMALFFFVIGLEIKRELVAGELKDIRAAALPVCAAAGGMILPALVFIAVMGDSDLARGWGIPVATDIAFAVGILTALGKRVPSALKVFLLTLAIIDDIGAILIIALVYADGIQGAWVLGAALSLGLVVVLRKAGIAHPSAYVPLGVFAWLCTYKAGIHPTIAGVALGLLTPAAIGGRQVLHDLEHALHPWTSYVVLPLFALANAGVVVGDGAFGAALENRLTWAIVAGLVGGKVVGVSAATWAGRKLGLGQLPDGVTMRHIVGVGGLAGIGFTVSLFIATLAYPSGDIQAVAKIGILIASVASAVIGCAVLLSGGSGQVQVRD